MPSSDPAVGQPGHALLPVDGGGTAGPLCSYRERGELQVLCTDLPFRDLNGCDLRSRYFSLFAWYAGVIKGFRNCPGHPEGCFETLRV